MGDVKAGLAVLVALVLGVSATASAAVPHGASALHKFTYSGAGTLPLPDGAEDWTCHATGGTGKFKHSHGSWGLHIKIHRVSNENGIQKNRFEETGAGRISWNAGG